MTAGSVEKSQKCHKYFFNTVNLLPQDLRFEQVDTKLGSCPRRHLTSLCPCDGVCTFYCKHTC